jgi:type I restriction enzyme, R subunit
MIVESFTQSGLMDPGQLYEPPFTGAYHQGIDGVFKDQDADDIISVLAEVNKRATV